MNPRPDISVGGVLSEVLQSIRLRSALYCRARMTAARWGFKVAPRDHARFHYVVSGACWIEVDDAQGPAQLKAGDLVILTQGQAHTLRDELDSPVQPLDELLLRLPLDERRNFVWENGGECTTLLCGGFRLEERKANPLLSSLPPVLVVRDGVGAGLSLRSAFQLVEAELAAAGPGSEAVVSRISDVIFLQAIRASFAAGGEQTPGLVRGLSDPAIARAIVALHGRLDQPWTIAAMAREAALSRSAFATRFAQFVGEPPMSYVSRWRLNRAALLLRSGNSSLADLAPRVGYQSEASLSRAFRRCFGLSPGAYRRHCAVSNGDAAATPPSIEKAPLYPSDFRDATFAGTAAAADHAKK